MPETTPTHLTSLSHCGSALVLFSEKVKATTLYAAIKARQTRTSRRSWSRPTLRMPSSLRSSWGRPGDQRLETNSAVDTDRKVRAPSRLHWSSLWDGFSFVSNLSEGQKKLVNIHHFQAKVLVNDYKWLDQKKKNICRLCAGLKSQWLQLSLPPILIFQELFSLNWLFVLCQTMQIYYTPAVFCFYWGEKVFTIFIVLQHLPV